VVQRQAVVDLLLQIFYRLRESSASQKTLLEGVNKAMTMTCAFLRPGMDLRLLGIPTTIFTKRLTNKSVHLPVRDRVKPAYNETSRYRIFSFEGRFLLIEVLQVKLKIIRDCKGFPLKTGFRSVQIPFKRDLTVYEKFPELCYRVVWQVITKESTCYLDGGNKGNVFL
jgi:hypothetical protein